jgi:ATP-dependent Clp protease ATP-binding subunit ClpA
VPSGGMTMLTLPWEPDPLNPAAHVAPRADEAERRGHSFVGTEHTLLGLLSEPDGIAGVVLRRLGAADAAATETRKIMDSEGYNRPPPKSGP